MNKLEILGYIWIFISMSLSMGLYKLEIRNHPIDKKHEYIKEHRIFGNREIYMNRLCANKTVLIDLSIVLRVAVIQFRKRFICHKSNPSFLF